MSKNNKITVTTLILVLIFLGGYLGRLYYFDVVEPKIIAKENNIDLLNIWHGQYYKIIEGKEKSTQKECFLIFIKNEETPHFIYADYGILKDEAVSFIENKGYTVVNIRLSLKSDFLHVNNKENIKPYLVWNVYYDEKNAGYFEVEFISNK